MGVHGGCIGRGLGDDCTIAELREQIAELSEFAQATVPRVEAAATYADLEELADRTARGLAHLAVAITELRRPTLIQRLRRFL